MMKGFRWPEPSELVQLVDRLRFDAGRSSLAKEWVNRRAAAAQALSYEQERRLVADEWIAEHSGPLYQPHLILTMAVPQPVETAEIQRALNRLLVRHAALRSWFERTVTHSTTERQSMLREAFHSGVIPSGLHHVRFASQMSMPLTHATIKVEGPAGAAAVFETVVADLSKPFDFATPPLIRGALIESPADGRLLAVAADRLVADWWSMTLLASELARDLSGMAPRAQPPPAIVVPSRRQRRLAIRQTRTSMSYWRDRWNGGQIQPVTCEHLVSSLPQSDLGPGSLAGSSVSLPAAQARALRDVARTTGEGLDDLLLTAVVTALQHATQRTSVSIWTERRQVALMSSPWLFGPCSTAHALFVPFVRARSVWDGLRAVREARRDAAIHEEIPLELIWRAARTGPLHRTGGIAFQYLRFDPSAQDGLVVVPWPLADTDPAIGLQFIAVDAGSNISMSAAFGRGRLPRATVDTLLADVVDLLGILAAGSGYQSRQAVSERRPLEEQADEYRIAADPTTCYLCRRRDVRTRTVDTLPDVDARPSHVSRIASIASRGRSKEAYIA